MVRKYVDIRDDNIRVSLDNQGGTSVLEINVEFETSNKRLALAKTA